MSKPTAVAVVVAAISAGALALAIGPLDPPAGPVTESSPSLADIQATLDQLVAGQSQDTITDGPFEIFTAPLAGTLTDNFAGSLVAKGRVYVDSISVQYAEATLFDGQGNVDGDGVTAGRWICRSFNLFSATGDGRSQFTTTTTPVRTVVENGLYATWYAQDNADGFIAVRFKRLPDLAQEGATE